MIIFMLTRLSNNFILKVKISSLDSDMKPHVHIYPPEALEAVDRNSLQQLGPPCFMGTVSNKHRLGCYATAVKIKQNGYDCNRTPGCLCRQEERYWQSILIAA